MSGYGRPARPEGAGRCPGAHRPRGRLRWRAVALFAFGPLGIATPPIPAQEAAGGEAVSIVRSGAGSYRAVERSDWARYDDGTYVGHVYREVRSSIAPVDGSAAVPGSTEYRGEFYVLQETTRDESRAARPVDDMVRASFRLFPDGTLTVETERGFPGLRGFPAFPSTPIRPGTRWTAPGVRAVDPRNDGTQTLLPLVAQYEYRGIESYKGTPVHRVVAKYATRYEVRTSKTATIARALGTHDVDILLRVEDALPLLMRDRLDETFTFGDGSTVRFKGFTLTFSEGFSPLDRGNAVAAIAEALGAGEAGAGNAGGGAGVVPAETNPGETPGTGGEAAAARPEPPTSLGVGAEPLGGAGTEAADFRLAEVETPAGVDIAATDEGIRLTVRNLRFKPDSDELLPEEKARLDLIVEALQRAGNRNVLVAGHTAAVGKPAGELDLSRRRAARIVQELIARGIPAERLMYLGYGGTRPLASNDTEAGRALNRRVEITILD